MATRCKWNLSHSFCWCRVSLSAAVVAAAAAAVCLPPLLSPSASASPLSAIHVHPLVVLSLADHYTREVCEKPAGSRRCLGLLFGRQDGRVVQVLETVEMAFRVDADGRPVLELEAVETDMQLCQQRGMEEEGERGGEGRSEHAMGAHSETAND